LANRFTQRHEFALLFDATNEVASESLTHNDTIGGLERFNVCQNLLMRAADQTRALRCRKLALPFCIDLGSELPRHDLETATSLSIIG
jgi:hypothetical protein